MIDICDFAVGLSRQLYGRTMTSERPGHRLMETWHPLGVVGVISAFNFPAAVWSWNTAVALVCGDPVIWKPSELAPLTALASQAILAQAIAECGAPADLSQVLVGGSDVGRRPRGPPRRRPAQCHWLHSHGPRRRTAGRGPVRPVPARARREQRRGRQPDCRPGPDHAWGGVLGGRHGGSAVHDDAPSHRAQQRDRRAHRAPGLGLRPAPGRQPDGGRHPGRPAHPRAAYEGLEHAIERAGTEGGKLVAGGGRELEAEAPQRVLRQARDRAHRLNRPRSCSRRRSRRFSTSSPTTTSRRRSR